jgi:hypothetical protein
MMIADEPLDELAADHARRTKDEDLHFRLTGSSRHQP